MNIVYQKNVAGGFDKTGEMEPGTSVQIQMDSYKPFGDMPVEKAIEIVEKTIANKATKDVERYTIIEDAERRKKKVAKEPGIKPRAMRQEEEKPEPGLDAKDVAQAMVAAVLKGPGTVAVVRLKVKREKTKPTEWAEL